MERERFEEIVGKLKIPTETWTRLDEIESIELQDGRAYYPSWKHHRFMITKKDEILVQYGNSYPYGARMPLNYNLDASGNIVFNVFNRIENTSYYENFRLPHMGDTIRFSNNGKILDEVPLINVKKYMNGTYLTLLKPIAYKNVSISFFDTTEYTNDELCMHGDIIEGIYMKFVPNETKHLRKIIYHDIIKIKNIKSIRLHIGNCVFNKVYDLE